MVALIPFASEVFLSRDRLIFIVFIFVGFSASEERVLERHRENTLALQRSSDDVLLSSELHV